MSTSKGFWNVIHCWERKSELTCYFLSCLLMHWLWKKQEAAFNPILSSKSMPCHQLSWLAEGRRGKGWRFWKAVKACAEKKKPDLSSLHESNKADAFSGSIYSGIPHWGPEEWLLSSHQSISPNEGGGETFSIKGNALSLTNVRVKEINQTCTNDRVSKLICTDGS